jgi:hypothetical protein
VDSRKTLFTIRDRCSFEEQRFIAFRVQETVWLPLS